MWTEPWVEADMPARYAGDWEIREGSVSYTHLDVYKRQKLVLTDGSKGMKGAIEKAEELKQNIEGSVILGQFTNAANPAVHRKTTGPEIWEDTDGAVDIFVAGIGTGGTITGVGQYLRERNPRIKVVAVEPAGSPILSEGRAGAHKIQGIGAGFIPEILAQDIYDEVIQVRCV